MRKANAKDRLLNTAGQLFQERGYSGVGINEIIQKAETAKASFYQHFNSKQALCEEWLSTMHERSEETHRDILGSEESPAAKIESYFNRLEDYMIASKFRGCPFSNTATVTEESCCGIRSRIEEHKSSIREFFRALAAQFVDSKKRANEIGDQLFILYSGATGESQTMRAIWPVEVARKAAIDLFKCEAKS